MREYDAWLNGKAVGQVEIDEETGRAKICCLLPTGWLYRSVLLYGETEVARFGVLLPDTKGFYGTARLPPGHCCNDELRCEVIRMRPGENTLSGLRKYLSQFEAYEKSLFTLNEPMASVIARKRNTYFHVYNKEYYFLVPMDFDQADPLVSVYSVGKILEVQGVWHLCVKTGADFEIIPWLKDEN